MDPENLLEMYTKNIYQNWSICKSEDIFFLASVSFLAKVLLKVHYLKKKKSFIKMQNPKSYENIIGEVVCPIPHPIPKHLAFRKQHHFYPRIIKFD